MFLLVFMRIEVGLPFLVVVHVRLVISIIGICLFMAIISLAAQLIQELRPAIIIVQARPVLSLLAIGLIIVIVLWLSP